MTAQNQYWTIVRWAVRGVMVRWPVALTFFTVCPILYGSDLLLIRGHIYTANPKQPWASALAITGSRIDGIGEKEALQAHLGAKTRVIDLEGRTVLPGIIDSHTHLWRCGASRIQPGYSRGLH
jgi:predicted amidohydrolase YtcJ